MNDPEPRPIPSVAELLAHDPWADGAPDDPLELVITMHARTGASVCYCGALPLGSSHAEHIAAAIRQDPAACASVAAAAAAHLQRWIAGLPDGQAS